MTTADRLKALRREPPAFRLVSVESVEPLTPRMVRVTFGGPDLVGFTVEQPAASARLLIPPPGESELVIPEWSGNEFLYDDGSRPVIRTLTPSLDAAGSQSTHLDVVVAHHGPLADWARKAQPGDPAAISGPGRGWVAPPSGTPMLVAGDESALPAIRQVLAAVGGAAEVELFVEIGHDEARLTMGDGVVPEWIDGEDGRGAGSALARRIESLDPGPDTYVWAAGEAASMQRIRKHVFGACGIDRSQATIRGYWKHSRNGDEGPETD